MTAPVEPTAAVIEAERARVVAWLRAVAKDARDWSEHADVYDALADAIENGEHRREEVQE